MPQLDEIVQQIVSAGLAPDQISMAAEIVGAIQAAGLDPAQVAAAVQAAIAPPIPERTPEAWSAWLSEITPAFQAARDTWGAVYAAIQTGDGPKAYRALAMLAQQATQIAEVL